MKGSTTMERCAASAGAAAFEATCAGAVVASGGTRLAPRRYQALAAANIAKAATPTASSASQEGVFRSVRFVRSWLADFQRIDADRLSDVLKLRRAEVSDLEIEPLLHLAIRVLGKTNGAGLGDPFEARGDVDAVAHQVAVALLDHAAPHTSSATSNLRSKQQLGTRGHFGPRLASDARTSPSHRPLTPLRQSPVP